MPNIPVVNLGNLYVYGLNISKASNSTLSVTAGGCRDSTNTLDLVIPSTTTIDFAKTGLNALDHGTVAAATNYSIWVVGDSSNNRPTGLIASASATAPTLPFGYDSKRRIGWALTDTPVANIILMYQTGDNSLRTYFFDTPIFAIEGGTATTPTALPLNPAIPAAITNSKVFLQINFIPAAAGNYVKIRPTGSSAIYTIAVSGAVAAVSQDVAAVCPFITTSIDYANTAGSVSIGIVGFEDYL